MKKIPFFNKLRVKIITWSFIPTTIILTAIAWLFLVSFQEATENLVIKQEQEFLQITTDEITFELSNAINPSLRDANLKLNSNSSMALPDRAALAWQDNINHNIFTGGYVLIDSDGYLIDTSSKELQQYLDSNFSSEKFFQFSKTNVGEVFFTDILSAELLGEPMLGVSYSIVSHDEKFDGILLMLVKVNSQSNSILSKAFSLLQLDEKYYLVDANKRILYHVDHNKISTDLNENKDIQQFFYQMQNSGSEENNQATQIKIGSGSAAHINDLVISAVPLEMGFTTWWLVKEQSWYDVIGTNLAYSQGLLLLLVMGIFVPAIVVGIGVSRVTQPIQAMISAAQQIAGGNFDQRVSAKSGDELETLAEQFNRMAARLQESYATLEGRVEARTHELATLNSLSEVVNRSLDLQEVLSDGLQMTLKIAALDGGAAYQVYGEKQTLQMITHSGFSEELADKLSSLPPEHVPFDQEAVQEGYTSYLVANCPASELKACLQEEGIRYGITLALKSKGELLGFFIMGKHDEQPPSKEEISVLQAVGQQIGVAMENSRLFQTVQERHQEAEQRRSMAEGIRDILAEINSSRPINEVLNYIVGQAVRLLKTNAVVIYRLDNNVLQVQAHFGLYDEIAKLEIPLGISVSGRAAAENQPVAASNMENYLANMKDETARKLNLEEQKVLYNAANHFQAVLAVPLIIKGQTYGTITLLYYKPRQFSSEDIDLAVTFAEQVTLAIENARLIEAEQDRRQELQTLLNIAATSSSTLSLDDVLDATLERLIALVNASKAAVLLFDEETNQLDLRNIHPRQRLSAQDLQELIELGSEVITSGASLHIPPEAPGMGSAPAIFLPLRVRQRSLGLLVIVGHGGKKLKKDQFPLYESIAGHLSVAIDNARLYEHAEQNAVIAERSRLARELHDAVTQTLFSASLLAEVLPMLWKNNQAEGERRLEELRQMTRGALAEMRSLLLELRPSALVDSDFDEVLRQLCDSFTSRTRIPVELNVNGKRQLAPDEQITFYRIAQESLNNIAKHASASKVEIYLHFSADSIKLVIVDDGKGFARSHVPPERLGINIMEERAANIGARLHITSNTGAGTQLTLTKTWSNDRA